MGLKPVEPAQPKQAGLALGEAGAVEAEPVVGAALGGAGAADHCVYVAVDGWRICCSVFVLRLCI